MPTWRDATAVQKVGRNTYTCELYDDWCIGTVPNGGYVTGCILEVVSTHFNTSLAKQNQPHTIALHVEFLRRTQAGSATFKVEEVKLGRQTSVVHVRLSQEGSEEVVAYATNSNMHTEEGASFDTQYTLSPPVPTVDLSKLEQDTDPNWEWQREPPWSKFRRATQKVKWYFPRDGHVAPHIKDEWICFSDGANFNNSSIGFLADMFPQIVESFRDESEGPFWYPTLVLNLDVKKSLPPEGVKWLQVRVQLKKVQNGRLDFEIHIHDAEGELIALSHHVGLVLDVSRNTASRRKPDAKI